MTEEERLRAEIKIAEIAALTAYLALLKEAEKAYVRGTAHFAAAYPAAE